MSDLKATDFDSHYAVAHEDDGEGKGRLTYHWSIEEAEEAAHRDEGDVPIYRVIYERIN